jgi:hypothetical protein
MCFIKQQTVTTLRLEFKKQQHKSYLSVLKKTKLHTHYFENSMIISICYLNHNANFQYTS